MPLIEFLKFVNNLLMSGLCNCYMDSDLLAISATLVLAVSKPIFTVRAKTR